ncbi:hypothetical protein ACOMHN_036938 [Nucella lapillus]
MCMMFMSLSLEWHKKTHPDLLFPNVYLTCILPGAGLLSFLVYNFLLLVICALLTSHTSDAENEERTLIFTCTNINLIIWQLTHRDRFRQLGHFSSATLGQGWTSSPWGHETRETPVKYSPFSGLAFRDTAAWVTATDARRSAIARVTWSTFAITVTLLPGLGSSVRALAVLVVALYIAEGGWVVDYGGFGLRISAALTNDTHGGRRARLTATDPRRQQ